MSEEEGTGLLMQYKFRVSSVILRTDKVKVKMTAGELPDLDNPGQMMRVDGWTTIFQRTPPETDNNDCWSGVYPKWKPGLEIEGEEPPGDLESFKDKGIITLRWDIAKQGGKRENTVNEMSVDGVFWGSAPNADGTVGTARKYEIIYEPHFPSYAIDPLVMSVYEDTPFEEMKIDMTGSDGESIELLIKHVRNKMFQIVSFNGVQTESYSEEVGNPLDILTDIMAKYAGVPYT